MISQVINLSNDKTFKLYKEKYKFFINIHKGLYGIELRKIHKEFSGTEIKLNSDNIFHSNDDLLLVGSLREIPENLYTSNFDENINAVITRTLQKYDECENISFNIGERNFNFRYAFAMGILNVTPDSFSDGGKFINIDKAVDNAIEMIEAGADIIDIGGESTRPGSESVSEKEELKRVIPVIIEILKMKPDTIISIDTTKARIAEEAIKCGASIVNDISGGTFDKDIFNVAKESNAAMVLMHLKGRPKTMQNSPEYVDVVSEVYDYLASQAEIASGIGIKKIIVDPGIGFGKRVEDNLALIERLEDFKSIGFPILIGMSRKSFIGNILNLPIEDRDDVTNALNSLALSKGARIIRTHNVKQAVQTCKIYNSIITN
ncbi:MAG: dihydropteroate synthase [Ignavibacteria bacterium]|nr:dihydropteroate synthase [Ignavibacteria bacterium]